MPDLHSLPIGSRPSKAVRNNGPDDLALERWKLRELAEGWPCYRDASEWTNFRSLFHPDAFVYTTWTGRIHHLDFIEASKRGLDEGVFIMHRCCGASTDIGGRTGEGGVCRWDRAVTKLKATITQRFLLKNIELVGGGKGDVEVDAEADCRFCFFFEKDPLSREWRARFVRHWYEKDKLIPVNPARVPVLDEERLAKYPAGYRYLSYCQEGAEGEGEGRRVRGDMPGHNREGDGSVNKRAHDELLWLCKRWVEGEEGVVV
ncbi:MAG: hypothetical protein Q9160_005571 [Pyrenula sp. 1 TL-2023]